MRSKVFWMAVWLVLGATALAQRIYLEAGTTTDLRFTFAQQTDFNLTATVDAGVRDLAGPFGVGGRFGIRVAEGGASFELGLSGLFHFGNYGTGISPLAGLGFQVEFGGGQTTFGLNGVAGIEYFLDRQLAFVARAEPTLRFAEGTSFRLNLRVGLRVYP
jgi:hypothetical protein